METDFERKNPVNVNPKTIGQLRGMVIILRGLVGEALKTMEAHIPHLGENYNYLRQAQTHLAYVDTANIDFNAVLNVWLSLDNAVKHDTAFNIARELIKSAFACADEMIADMPIPFSAVRTLLPENIPVPQSGAVKPTFQHGKRVKLTIDLPDETTPLFKGDMGTVNYVPNAIGVLFNRYAEDGMTAVSRLLNGVKVQVIDYCVPADSDDTQEIPELQRSPIPAFDNALVTGDVKYGGDGHRCIDIARECLARGLWYGKTKLHICGDVQAVHRHIFFLRENPFVSYHSDNPGQEFCYINLLDVPVGGARWR